MATKLTPLPPLRPKAGGWGERAVGRWFEAEGNATEAAGVCCRCLTEKPAVELFHRQGPFGRWSGWVCSDCDPEPRRRKPQPVSKRRPKW